MIRDEYGQDIIAAGNGNDNIAITLAESAFVVLGDEGYENVPVGSVMAGDGDDTVTVTNAHFGTFEPGETPSYSVDLGAGDDRLITDGHFGTITLGAGRDTIEFVSGVDSYGSVVTDFETGAAGDVMDFGELLGFGIDVASDAVVNLLENGGNPFELGVYYLEQDGNDVRLMLRPSVSGNFTDYLVATFENTNVSDFTAENFCGFDPHVVPAIPTYIETNTTVAAGSLATSTNVVPDDSVLAFGSSHIVYRANDDSAYVNNGTARFVDGRTWVTEFRLVSP